MISRNNDTRWKQRLSNFESAFEKFNEAVTLAKSRKLTDLESQGLIQAFEFTHELSWNLLKDYFESQGTQGITGSKDACREAFQKGLIADGEAWMEMILSRNKTSHTYNKAVALEICDKIVSSYHPSFVQLRQKMQELAKK